jgi:hypothetical protein
MPARQKPNTRERGVSVPSLFGEESLSWTKRKGKGLTVIGHCVQCRARAAAVTGLWGYILGPAAPFSWLSLGRHTTDPALEGHRIDEGEGKIPEEQVDAKGGLEDFRDNPTPDTAQSGDDEHHDG